MLPLNTVLGVQLRNRAEINETKMILVYCIFTDRKIIDIKYTFIDNELFNRNFKEGTFCRNKIAFYLRSVFEYIQLVGLR
jgi:hypothetical protein